MLSQKWKSGLGYSSMLELLCSMREALSWVPNNTHTHTEIPWEGLIQSPRQVSKSSVFQITLVGLLKFVTSWHYSLYTYIPVVKFPSMYQWVFNSEDFWNAGSSCQQLWQRYLTCGCTRQWWERIKGLLGPAPGQPKLWRPYLSHTHTLRSTNVMDLIETWWWEGSSLRIWGRPFLMRR